MENPRERRRIGQLFKAITNGYLFTALRRFRIHSKSNVFPLKPHGALYHGMQHAKKMGSACGRYHLTAQRHGDGGLARIDGLEPP